MLRAESKRIIMDECDYGLNLPIYLKGDVLSTDKITFTIKKSLYDNENVIRKEFTNLKQEDSKFFFDLSFSEEETKLLPAGDYIYIIQQCRDCELHNTIIRNETFKVEKGCKL